MTDSSRFGAPWLRILLAANSSGRSIGNTLADEGFDAIGINLNYLRWVSRNRVVKQGIYNFSMGSLRGFLEGKSELYSNINGLYFYRPLPGPS